MDEYKNPFNRSNYARACSKTKQRLLECLLESECYKVEKKTPRECLQRGSDMPSECHPLRIAYYNCKRSQVDPRFRFRGKYEED